MKASTAPWFALRRVEGLALAAVLAAALPAVAQDRPLTSDKDKTDTIKVTVSGDVVLDYVYRSSELTAFTDSESNNAGAGAAAVSDSENTFEGHIAARIDVQLSNKISAVLEIGTKRVDGSPSATPPDGGILRWGDQNALDIDLREANVTVTDFLLEGLKVQLGLSNWAFDIRGKGSPFAFAPRRSQTIERNFDSITALVNGVETPDGRLIEAAFVDENEPVGAVLDYTSEAFSMGVVILPATIEGGAATDDEATYGLWFMYALDSLGKGSRIGALVALDAFRSDSLLGGADNEDSRVYTIGGGGTFMLLDGALELYAEAYFQFGHVTESVGGDVDAAGRAFQFGAVWRHTVGNPLPIWAGFNYFFYSGDDDTDPNDDEVNRFGAYEGVNDLLILEDHYLGFDWDSNYTGFKISAGTTFSAAAERDLDVALIVGITRAAEDVGAGANSEDALGNEVDLKLKWSVSKQFALRLSIGMLFGSDILENAMDGGVPGSNPDAEDNAGLWLLGFDMRF